MGEVANKRDGEGAKISPWMGVQIFRFDSNKSKDLDSANEKALSIWEGFFVVQTREIANLLLQFRLFAIRLTRSVSMPWQADK